MIIELDCYTTLDGMEIYQVKLEGSAYMFEAAYPEVAIGKAILAHKDTVIQPVVKPSEICEDCMTGAQLVCLNQIKRYDRTDTPQAFATAKRQWAARWPALRPQGIVW